jgi:hypothetical protein
LNGTGVGGGVFTGAPAIAAARVRTVVIDRTTNANARLIQNGLFLLQQNLCTFISNFLTKLLFVVAKIYNYVIQF